ncbi:MAG TPA: chromate transporter [Candidatus Angelobacter sp.]|nr:chromate transporter [Candidatus Angelobacter sp.]
MSQVVTTEPTAQTRPPERILPQLVWYFLRLGTWGFGGPIALAGYMQRDLVEEKRWFTKQEYLDGLALSQLAPGPLAAQLAMYLGLLRGGTLGASLVGLAFIAPSFLMVLALSHVYVKFGGLRWMQAAFYGVGAAVIAIIARSAFKLVKTAVGKDKLLWCIFVVLLASTAITQREIVWLFLAGGLLSLVVKARPKLSTIKASCVLLTGGGLAANPSLFLQILFFFTKSSLFVFGSGLAIVPFLHGGVVLERHWLTEQQFIDAVAVAMITPGPVVITVGFIGYIVHGWSGAVAAALGVFLPVYLVVVIAGPFYKKFAGNPQLRAFVQGVTAAATGAIAGATVVLARRSVMDVPTILLAVISLLLLFKWKIPEPLLILVAAIAGLLLHR